MGYQTAPVEREKTRFYLLNIKPAAVAFKFLMMNTDSRRSNVEYTVHVAHPSSSGHRTVPALKCISLFPS